MNDKKKFSPKENLLFGTSGIPESAQGNTIAGIIKIKELGLDAMEIEFVRGVYIKKEYAASVRDYAKRYGVVLTAHAPYFINLNSYDTEKVIASCERIKNTCIISEEAGIISFAFHPAYYGKSSQQDTFEKVKSSLEHILSGLSDDGIIRVDLRPEIAGKLSQFGSLDEVIGLSKLFVNVKPCIDFAHIYSRSIGKLNSYEGFCSVLERIQKELGKEGLQDMHIHMAGIQYSQRGEVRHLNLEDSDFNYKDVLKALKDFDARGVVIAESINPQRDALLLKSLWNKM